MLPTDPVQVVAEARKVLGLHWVKEHGRCVRCGDFGPCPEARLLVMINGLVSRDDEKELCPECQDSDGRSEFEGFCSETCRDNAGERQDERRYGGGL